MGVGQRRNGAIFFFRRTVVRHGSNLFNAVPKETSRMDIGCGCDALFGGSAIAVATLETPSSGCCCRCKPGSRRRRDVTWRAHHLCAVRCAVKVHRFALVVLRYPIYLSMFYVFSLESFGEKVGTARHSAPMWAGGFGFLRTKRRRRFFACLLSLSLSCLLH